MFEVFILLCFYTVLNVVYISLFYRFTVYIAIYINASICRKYFCFLLDHFINALLYIVSFNPVAKIIFLLRV